MTTQIRKPVLSTARVAAIGLLSLVAMTTWADKANAQSETAPAMLGHIEVTARREPAMMGHIEVTARPVRVAADGASLFAQALDSLPIIGGMTVTATRIPTVAEHSNQPASTGEPATRTRSPRAVLVQ